MKEKNGILKMGMEGMDESTRGAFLSNYFPHLFRNMREHHISYNTFANKPDAHFLAYTWDKVTTYGIVIYYLIWLYMFAHNS